MAELETKPVVTEETLTPVRGRSGSLLERWVQADPKAAIERMETMMVLIEKLRTVSIRSTFPSDWICHTATDRDGAILSQRCYLQDIGAERAGKPWGIEVGMPAIEREDFPDGTFTYHFVADAWSHVTGERLDYVEGSRWSGDPFFARQVKDPEVDKVDPSDVRKAAYSNAHGRAVRSLAGLNGVPIDMLKQAGLDVNKVIHVNYAPGTKSSQSSGAATVGSSEAMVNFGNAKGTKVSDLKDADLGWYVTTITANIQDAGKANFKKANERLLDSLLKEKERRSQSAAHTEATGTKPEPPTDTAAPTPRGKMIGDLWTNLQDAAGPRALELFHKVADEAIGHRPNALSDLTDEELKKMATVPLANLKTVAGTLDKGKK